MFFSSFCTNLSFYARKQLFSGRVEEYFQAFCTLTISLIPVIATILTQKVFHLTLSRQKAQITFECLLFVT